MAGFNFPIESTKVAGVTKSFDLANPGQRKIYFHLKAGEEIKKIKTYLETNTFVALMIGKKGSGKGTYVGLMKEIFGDDKIAQISVGDITRVVFEEIKTKEGMDSLKNYLEKNYRGPISVDEALGAFVNKSQGRLLPTEFILALITREIEKLPKKAIFIDGFPRSMDQVSYSLYLRQIINFRNDPDFLVMIDIPEAVIDARIKTRVICAKCQTSRNVSLLPTTKIGFDEKTKEYYLICDKPGCGGGRMVRKEGDEQGIEPIRERLDTDQQLMMFIKDLYGIGKIYLRNAVPMEKAKELFDDYEITSEFFYERDSFGKILVKSKAWVIKDDDGINSISLTAPVVVLSLIRQLSRLLPQ